MKLRIKILSGFLVLAFMLFVAGMWSIVEFNDIGASVRQALLENHKSISASKNMQQALNEENRAVLTLLRGDWENGRAALIKADSSFSANLSFAYSNVTVKNEKEKLDKINKYYLQIKSLWKKPIVDTKRQGNLDWYFNNFYADFEKISGVIDSVIKMNDDMLFNASKNLKDRTGRAVMPGIIAVITAFIFSLIFSYLVNIFLINPIIEITENIKKFNERGVDFSVRVKTNDELADLSNEVRNLCEVISSERNR